MFCFGINVSLLIQTQMKIRPKKFLHSGGEIEAYNKTLKFF